MIRLNFTEWTGRKRLLAHFAAAAASIGLLWLLGLFIFDKVVMPHVVGKGAALVEVPSIVGKSPEEASSLLQSAGLQPILDPELKRSETVAQGLIALQSPTAGSQVKTGHSVRFWTSAGRTSVVVPEVGGQDSTKAARSLEEAGLVLGAPDHQIDSTVPAGKVVRTNPAAGSKLSPGSKISLVLSSGKEAKDTTHAASDTPQGRGLF
jgi:serine/threonine-protein kinase